MQRHRAHLPPLDALVAFEAAARLENFTAAARELNVTQSAVSQQIRNLEASLGVALFERAGRRVRLTHLGKEYQHTIARALEQVANASREIRLMRGRPRITLAADQAIAWLWLRRRLPAFEAAHPEVRLRLVVSDSLAACLDEGVALALLHGRGEWPGWRAERLFREVVFPVCSPAYLASAPPLARLEDLAAHTLLHLEDDEWQWINWRMWLTEQGLDAPGERHGLVANNYALLVEAAKAGQGVALGWEVLVDDALAEGTLVAPLDARLATEAGYWLARPEGAAPMPEAELLARFLVECPGP